jgi:uncharacterized membrane protein YbhN (UPF0104 family)
LSESRRSSAWAIAARVAVSVALLWFVSRYVDVAAVLSRLSELEPGWVALGLAVSVLQVGVLAWRWRYTAARLGVDLPLRRALGEYYLGILINQLLPGGVAGDVTRAWRHTRTDVPAGPAVRAVILERASAQVVMTLAAVASVLVLPWASSALRVTAAVAAAVLFGLVLGLLARPAAPASAAGRLWADTRRALLAWDALAAQLATALLVVASYIVVFLVAARALGVETPLATILPLVAPVLMTMLIPVTVAGWGIREAAAAALWGLAGLTPADGAAISVTYGLLVLVSSAPGLVVLTRTVIGGRGRRARPPRA